MEVKGSRSGRMSSLEGVPLKIFVSTRTGRRYLCVYQEMGRRFNNVRLDCISEAAPVGGMSVTMRNWLKSWRGIRRIAGVFSFGGSNSRLEEVVIKLWIDEKRSLYIINRLTREGRGGEVLRIRKMNIFTAALFDTNEMLSWVKTFTGREFWIYRAAVRHP